MSRSPILVPCNQKLIYDLTPILHRLRHIASIYQTNVMFCTESLVVMLYYVCLYSLGSFIVLCVFMCSAFKPSPPTEWFAWDELRKIFRGCQRMASRVVIDIFQRYRRYSISMPALKVSSIPIWILCRKSIDIEIDTSISILL